MLLMTAREQAGLCGERRLKLQTAGCTADRQMHRGQADAQRPAGCTEDRQMHSRQADAQRPAGCSSDGGKTANNDAMGEIQWI